MDACIDAHVAYMKLKEEEPIDYQKEMSNYLDMMGCLDFMFNLISTVASFKNLAD